MHEMGFKIANSYQEMTRRQRIFFQYAYIRKQNLMKEIYEGKDVDAKKKAEDIVNRSR
jgi:hypothetical protein